MVLYISNKNQRFFYVSILQISNDFSQENKSIHEGLLHVKLVFAAMPWFFYLTWYLYLRLVFFSYIPTAADAQLFSSIFYFQLLSRPSLLISSFERFYFRKYIEHNINNIINNNSHSAKQSAFYRPSRYPSTRTHHAYNDDAQITPFDCMLRG